MPAWLSPVLAVVTSVFSVGVAWGIFTHKQRQGENAQAQLVKDLKECVTKLQSLITDVEIVKVASARVEKKTEELERRITALEVTAAKLGRTTRRKV